jgi:hypothetical protein
VSPEPKIRARLIKRVKKVVKKEATKEVKKEATKEDKKETADRICHYTPRSERRPIWSIPPSPELSPVPVSEGPQALVQSLTTSLPKSPIPHMVEQSSACPSLEDYQVWRLKMSLEFCKCRLSLILVT